MVDYKHWLIRGQVGVQFILPDELHSEHVRAMSYWFTRSTEIITSAVTFEGMVEICRVPFGLECLLSNAEG